jgi:hypothetical protein
MPEHLFTDNQSAKQSKHTMPHEAIFFGVLSLVSLAILCVAMTADISNRIVPVALACLASSVSINSFIIFSKDN